MPRQSGFTHTHIVHVLCDDLFIFSRKQQVNSCTNSGELEYRRQNKNISSLHELVVLDSDVCINIRRQCMIADGDGTK